MSEEQVEKFDSKQVEQEMLKAAENRAVDPAESAAMVYSMYRPEFLKRIPKLSSKAMRRVLQLMIEMPLNEKQLSGTTQVEREVLMLGDAMLQSKFVMMLDTYKDGAEQLVAAQEEMIFGKEAEVTPEIGE